MFNNHITMANDNNHIIMSIVQCQPPIRQFSQQSVIVPKMAAAQVFAKTMGSMFECVTKVCRTQNSVSKTLEKAHQQNANCIEKCLHRSQRN